jgi:3-hydroxyacyl-CoA dehydrogenase
MKVIRIPETSDETYEKMVAWGKALGKTTITCKDTPGFVVNRLLVPLLAEAVRMLERGKLSSTTKLTSVKTPNCCPF